MKDFLRQFKGKDHGPLVQFIKYSIAGGVATVVHVCIFFTMAWKAFPALTGDDPIAMLLKITPSPITDGLRARNAAIDNFIAFMISNFVVYLINIYWVFESGRHSRWKEIGIFYLVAGASVAIGIGLQSFLIDYFGITTTLAFGAMILVCLMINYVVRKFFIFKG